MSKNKIDIIFLIFKMLFLIKGNISWPYLQNVTQKIL